MNKTSPKIRSLLCLFLTIFLFSSSEIIAQKRRLPTGGRIAVVVDERLSALRESPELSGKLLQRLSRGRFVAIQAERRTGAGLVFCRVRITTRTTGWIQCDALVQSYRKNDDERLLRLIQASHDFDRLVRAKIFLEVFRSSRLRPVVLLLYGDTAEAAAAKLTSEATRRLDVPEMRAGGAPQFSYFLNYNGLDRYNRQGVHFVFDRESTRFHYNGAAWREIIRRHPRSTEAKEARKRLNTTTTGLGQHRYRNALDWLCTKKALPSSKHRRNLTVTAPLRFGWFTPALSFCPKENQSESGGKPLFPT